MSLGNTRIARVRYNLEFSGYEAMVFIHEGADVFSYPSFVPAPLDADYALVMRELTNKALRKHRSKAPGLRSHMRRANETSHAPEHPPLAA